MRCSGKHTSLQRQLLMRCSGKQTSLQRQILMRCSGKQRHHHVAYLLYAYLRQRLRARVILSGEALSAVLVALEDGLSTKQSIAASLHADATPPIAAANCNCTIAAAQHARRYNTTNTQLLMQPLPATSAAALLTYTTTHCTTTLPQPCDWCCSTIAHAAAP